MFQKNIDFLVHLGMAALGGAVGATARYALGLIPVKTVFPWVTFFINLTGALEVLNLLEEDHLFTGILYAVASICTCLLEVWVGRRLAGYCI